MSYITFSVYDETICKQFHLNALPVIITLLIYLKLVVLVRVLISEGGGGGVLPYKRLIGMCRWMGSDFHDWID